MNSESDALRRKRLIRAATLVGSLLALIPTPLAAEERHHLSLSVGQSDISDLDENGHTLGVDYEYAVSEQFRIGFVVERAQGDLDATSLFTVIDVHWTERLVLQVGPGY